MFREPSKGTVLALAAEPVPDWLQNRSWGHEANSLDRLQVMCYTYFTLESF